MSQALAATAAKRGGHAAERALVEGCERPLAPQRSRWQRQVVQRRTVVIVRVVPVFAALEQGAELDRLVRLVMVHRPGVEPGETQ